MIFVSRAFAITPDFHLYIWVLLTVIFLDLVSVRWIRNDKKKWREMNVERHYNKSQIVNMKQVNTE